MYTIMRCHNLVRRAGKNKPVLAPFLGRRSPRRLFRPPEVERKRKKRKRKGGGRWREREREGKERERGKGIRREREKGGPAGSGRGNGRMGRRDRGIRWGMDRGWG